MMAPPLGKNQRAYQFARRFFPGVLILTLVFAGLFSISCLGSKVVAWGAGLTTNPPDLYDYGQSVIPASLTNAVIVASGDTKSFALKSDGTIQGWGYDIFSGEGIYNDFPTTPGYESIACGYYHSLALNTNGTVIAVGDDRYGQIEVPANLSNVVAIACGWFNCLALKSDGTVSAWGGAGIMDYGQETVPNNLSNVVAISSGAYFDMALKSDGTVFAWGANGNGNGDQNFGETNVPAGLSNVVAIAAGGWHGLALKNNGTVVGWGLNGDGQTSVPANLSNVVAIAAGNWHSLALKSNGTVVAWGYNGDGETNVPANLTNVIQIAAGEQNSLALVGNGPPVVHALLSHPNFGTNGFSVSLPTQNGRVYQLLSKSSLTDSAWQSLPLNAGTGGNLLLTNSVIAGQQFYEAQRW
jgi:alpha-tubulin suppressor-like RCC1 family protein